MNALDILVSAVKEKGLYSVRENEFQELWNEMTERFQSFLACHSLLNYSPVLQKNGTTITAVGKFVATGKCEFVSALGVIKITQDILSWRGDVIVWANDKVIVNLAQLLNLLKKMEEEQTRLIRSSSKITFKNHRSLEEILLEEETPSSKEKLYLTQKIQKIPENKRHNPYRG